MILEPRKIKSDTVSTVSPSISHEVIGPGFSRQEYWSGLPFPSPGYLPNPGIEPGSPALEADALTSEPPGKPEKFNLPRLNQEEIEIKNNPITNTEIEAVTKNLTKKQKPRTRWLHRIILLNI